MTDTFPFRCPMCGTILKVATKYIGVSGTCNKCGKPITIELKPPPMPIVTTEAPPDLPSASTRPKPPREEIRPHRGFVRKIVKQTARGNETLDIHFGLQETAQKYYAKRDHDPDALEIAAEACRQQIEMSSDAKAAWLSEYGDALPEHHGYKQLSIILDKQNRYADAVEVCQEARSEGWNGDWEKRIERYKKELAKEKS